MALSLLAVPLNAALLEALTAGAKSLVGLRRAVGSPPTTTMERHLRGLARAGVVERRGRNAFSGEARVGLTPGGHGLLDAAAALKGWLAAAPGAQLEFGTADAGRTVRALVNGWSDGTVRVLAARPLSLAEFDRIVKSASSASLERRLRAMQLAGLIEPVPGAGSVLRYRPTPWLQHAITPLAAAAHWERLNGVEGARPISRLDVEAAFLLATPLVQLPRQLDGVCRLMVKVQPVESKHAGALVTVERGQVVSCVTRFHGHADSWVAGSPSSWLQAVIKGQAESLETGGDDALAGGLLESLHSVLFEAKGP